MTPRGRSMVLLAALIVPVPVGRAEEPPPLVRDEADFFQPATRARLEKDIREIRRLYHRDLSVETIAALSAEEKQRLKSLNRRNEVQYLNDLGRARAQAAGVEGISILICRDPRRVIVTVGPDAQAQAFTVEDAENVRKMIAHRLLVGRLAGGPDRVIVDAVERVNRILRANLSRDDPERGLASGWSMALTIGGVLALWAVLRFLSRGSEVALGDREPAGARAAMLGSMFGSPASLWIYDRLLPQPQAGASGQLTIEEIELPAVVPAPPTTATLGSAAPSLPAGGASAG